VGYRIRQIAYLRESKFGILQIFPFVQCLNDRTAWGLLSLLSLLSLSVGPSSTSLLHSTQSTVRQYWRNLFHIEWEICSVLSFFNVRQSYCARYSYRLDVCLSVRPSVRQSVCLSVRPSHAGIVSKTAQPIVKLSLLPGSPMILVLWGPNFFQEFEWEHPNARGMKKLQFPTNISL